MNRLLFIISLLLFGHVSGQKTYVPDDNFEAYLETHNAIGTVVPLGDPTAMGDGKAANDSVLTAQISLVSYLFIGNLNIADLTGIEYFTSLEELNCSYNQLISLDVTNNPSLIELYCSHNQLSSLYFDNNTALNYLNCRVNQLNNLDLSNVSNLTFLRCMENPLNHLNISGNMFLEFIDVSNTLIEHIDLSQNINLHTFYAEESNIKYVDFSNNFNLSEIDFEYGELIGLNLKNGNNYNIAYFDTYDNPNLYCIQVDDPVWSTANWSYVDEQAFFSSDCNYLTENIIELPSALTPNSDGFNDVWDIIGLHNYPNMQLQIFDRWGQLIYEQKGQYTDWDGTYNGKRVPVADYFYVITLGTEGEPHKGTVTVKY